MPNLQGSSLLSAWEQAITDGNAAFTSQNDDMAIKYYQDALKLAQHIISMKLWLNFIGNRDSDAICIFESSIAALIVTYNNIINLTIQLKQIPRAMNYFHQARTAILQLLQDKSLDNKMQNITERHLYRFLSGSIQLLGTDEEIETWLSSNLSYSKKLH